MYHAPRPYVATPPKDPNAPPLPASSYATFYGGNVALAHPRDSFPLWMKIAAGLAVGYVLLRL